MVDFQGKTVAAIRIRLAPRKGGAATIERPARSEPTQDDPRTLNDDIPF
jgi:hypothetical protein